MKKVKVFISSTFKDLEHYRTEVDKTIRVLDSESISMEHFGSDHRQPLEVCLTAIEDCDLFVGIYGLRYGFTPPRQSLSITELEYNHAITQGKPILAFISEDTIQYEKDYVSEAVSTDSAEVLKLKSFKDRIRIERVIREFVTKDELGKYMAIELGKYYIKIIRGQTLSNPLTHLPLPNDIYYPTGSPYVGLRCFSRREAKVFYGRNQLIFDLYQKLHQPEPIILVYGQTGVGKSSVLDAGLLPRLEKQNCLIFPLKRLYEQGLPNQLNIILQELKKSDENHLLIIDQVEELWTNPNPQLKTEKEDFFKIIYSILEPYDKNFKIILSFRKEFLAEVRDALTGLPYLEQMVKPMNQPELIEAITQIYQDKDAFKRYHIKVSEELPHEISYDLRKDEKSHLAPLLQATLSQMWEFASKTGFEEEISFDHDLYNQVKTESLEGFLKAQLNKIGESYPESLENGLLLDILNHFTTDLGTSAQHSLTELNERYSHIANLNDILIAFENKYLLLKNDKQTFKLSHDSLAPLVQKAFRISEAAGQKAARILELKFQNWRINDNTQIDFTDQELISILEGALFTRNFNEVEKSIINKAILKNKSKLKLEEERKKFTEEALYKYCLIECLKEYENKNYITSFILTELLYSILPRPRIKSLLIQNSFEISYQFRNYPSEIILFCLNAHFNDIIYIEKNRIFNYSELSKDSYPYNYIYVRSDSKFVNFGYFNKSLNYYYIDDENNIIEIQRETKSQKIIFSSNESIKRIIFNKTDSILAVLTITNKLILYKIIQQQILCSLNIINENVECYLDTESDYILLQDNNIFIKISKKDGRQVNYLNFFANMNTFNEDLYERIVEFLNDIKFSNDVIIKSLNNESFVYYFFEHHSFLLCIENSYYLYSDNKFIKLNNELSFTSVLDIKRINSIEYVFLLKNQLAHFNIETREILLVTKINKDNYLNYLSNGIFLVFNKKINQLTVFRLSNGKKEKITELNSKFTLNDIRNAQYKNNTIYITKNGVICSIIWDYTHIQNFIYTSFFKNISKFRQVFYSIANLEHNYQDRKYISQKFYDFIPFSFIDFILIKGIDGEYFFQNEFSKRAFILNKLWMRLVTSKDKTLIIETLKVIYCHNLKMISELDILNNRLEELEIFEYFELAKYLKKNNLTNLGKELVNSCSKNWKYYSNYFEFTSVDNFIDLSDFIF